MLEDNQKLRKKMKAIGAPATEFLQLKIADATVDAWMMKPVDFDPSRKYPLFVYVYGEPHAQTVLDRWGTSHADFHRLLAEMGYLVVSIDNRGTTVHLRMLMVRYLLDHLPSGGRHCGRSR